MSEFDPSGIRISDTEREDAMRKLGEHMSVGRLDVDEYGERTAKVTAAKTRGELTELFMDLPDPRPSFGPPVKAAPAAAPDQRRGQWTDQPPAQRIWAAMVPLSAVLALVLFVAVLRGVWFIFLLPAVIAMIGGALWGEGWRHHRRGYYHRTHHRR